MYTDLQQWQLLLDEVFVTDIWFDASSVGAGAPSLLPATTVCDMWKQGFAGLDAVHHQAGHYITDIKGDEANIFGYAIASHYKATAVNGKTRTFTGSCDLKAARTTGGWRLHQFKYNLKFVDGNGSLE